MTKRVFVGLVVLAVILSTAKATILTQTWDLTIPAPTSKVQNLNGLSTRAIFTYDTTFPNVLKIELFNTSTGVPAGFSNADQLLTSISFDFGSPGYNSDPKITSGTV